jgi:PIN domain
MPVPKNFVFIDYENVQPKNMDLLNSDAFRVFVFVGENQSKLSFDLVSAIQKMGESAEYIKIAGNGPNALDFHIAYYLGQLAAEEPKGWFHIISRDTGFDPLVKHLKSMGIKTRRQKDISEIPALRVSSSKSDTEKLSAIVQNLRTRGQSKPRKLVTLSNTINSIFTETLPESELQSLINEMGQRGYITVNEGKVSYSLTEQ